jgi:hypothetical protein
MARPLTDAVVTAVAVHEPFTDAVPEGLMPVLRHQAALAGKPPNRRADRRGAGGRARPRRRSRGSDHFPAHEVVRVHAVVAGAAFELDGQDVARADRGRCVEQREAAEIQLVRSWRESTVRVPPPTSRRIQQAIPSNTGLRGGHDVAEVHAGDRQPDVEGAVALEISSGARTERTQARQA